VDLGKVSTKHVCAARRVYAIEIDEWVAGQKMVCKLCKAEKEKLQSELSFSALSAGTT
jgi:hypothetical protein